MRSGVRRGRRFRGAAVFGAAAGRLAKSPIEVRKASTPRRRPTGAGCCSRRGRVRHRGICSRRPRRAIKRRRRAPGAHGAAQVLGAEARGASPVVAQRYEHDGEDLAQRGGRATAPMANTHRRRGRSAPRRAIPARADAGRAQAADASRSSAGSTRGKTPPPIAAMPATWPLQCSLKMRRRAASAASGPRSRARCAGTTSRLITLQARRSARQHEAELAEALERRRKTEGDGVISAQP